jgi:hypothetical protein
MMSNRARRSRHRRSREAAGARLRLPSQKNIAGFPGQGKKLIAGGVIAVFVLTITACGAPRSSEPPPPRGTPSAAKSAPAATPGQAMPSAGADLASVAGQGRVNVISNVQGKGFDVVDSLLDMNYNDVSTVQAFAADGRPLAKLPAGSLTGECGAADVINDRGRLLITERIKTVPAAGISPATNSLVMTAWNATNGRQVWTATPIPSTTDPLSCQAFDGDLQYFSSTYDGQWGVLTWPLSNSQVADAIDLTSGRLFPNADLQGVLGDYVVTGTDHTYYTGDPNIATLTTPGIWQPLGTFKLGGDDPGEIPLDPGEFAPTGQLANQGYSNPPSMEATPDGRELIGTLGNSGNQVSFTVNAYALPSARLLWSVATPQYYTDTLEGIDASAVIIGRAQNSGGSTALIALDVKTGKVMWQVNVGAGMLCDLTSSQILVAANGQLATLSAATGKQLSYQNDAYQDSSGDPSCPTTVADGLTGLGYNNARVTQLLAP